MLLNIEFRIFFSNEVYWRTLKGNPKKISDGSIIWSGVITDSTENRNHIEDLKEARKAADESNHFKTVFINNLSHEIRTPLNGIMGFSELMSIPDITAEKRKYYSAHVIDSGYQLLKVIDNILEISDIDSNRSRVNLSVFYLNDFLLDVSLSFEKQSKKKNVPIVIKSPQPNNKIKIKTDKTRLINILNNIIENALKFTDEGYIEIGYIQNVKVLEIYVKDTGLGIAPEYLNAIFERFVQEDFKLSRKAEGLGIGLSIAQGNARLLGGKVTVVSEKGKGSVFYINIPYSLID